MILFSLDRMSHRVAWPKMIGGILALESAGLILWQHEWWWYRISVTHGHVMGVEWFFLALAVVLSALSYYVYCAREWARRAVIVLGLIAVATLILNIADAAFHEIGRVPEFAREVTSEARAWQIRSVVRSAGATLCVAAPLALLVCVLAHRDVACLFRTRTQMRSNQALQRTAPRSDA